MKNKGIIIVAVILFLVINTIDYWAASIGSWVFQTLLFLSVIYLLLIIAWFRQMIFLFKEKWRNKSRLINTILLALILGLIGYIFPDRTALYPSDQPYILIAGREGAANCTTTIKLKKDFTFKVQDICFGIRVVVGKYRIMNDTIYLAYDENGESKGERYQFARIEELKYATGNPLALKLYRDQYDTAGFDYFIMKNELDIPIKKNSGH